MSRQAYEFVERLVRGSSIKTVNTKLTIQTDGYDCELFVKLGWASGRWVWIDVDMSRYTESHIPGETPEVADLRRQLADANRRMMEVICKHASELLQSDERTIDGVMESWRGTRFAPHGTCYALKTVNMPGATSSPLDAVAQLVEQRRIKWEQQMEESSGR